MAEHSKSSDEKREKATKSDSAEKGKTMNKYCPCCGHPIRVGQEVCLNCLVYLWEV